MCRTLKAQKHSYLTEHTKIRRVFFFGLKEPCRVVGLMINRSRVRINVATTNNSKEVKNDQLNHPQILTLAVKRHLITSVK